MKTLTEFVKENRYFVAAHRGSSGTAPENTLSSFRQALEAGASMIETDIQLTSDGHVVSFHDKSLSRTSDGSGFVKETELSTIKTLDAGSWFSDKYKGEPIPLLSDVLELIKGKMYLNLEVKNIKSGDLNDKIHKIVSVIHEYNYEEYTLFGSFYYDTLYLLKKEYPNLHTAAIMIPRDSRLPSEISNETGCEGFVCSVDELNHEISDDASKNGIYIGVYSVDNFELLDEVLKYNVKAIVSNFPAMIVNVMKSRSLI